MAILVNDGSGHFLAGPLLDAPSARAVAAGDLNGDGALDLAIAQQASSLVQLALSKP